MLFGKQRKEEAKSAKPDKKKKAKGATEPLAAEPKAAAPLEDVAATANPPAHFSSPLVVVTEVAQLEWVPGRPATGVFEGGWLQLGSTDGGRTVASFPAREGDVFEGTAITVLVDPGANGLPSRFMFGPMFLDADEKVLTWWKPFPKPSNEPAEITVTEQAPAGTASVRLGVRGTWDSKGETGDYVVGFAHARLAKVGG
jgi:hypothetical protein